MSRYKTRQEMAPLKPNRHCPRDREINLLLLGPTGVGKTTFINAFANYAINNTLQEAVEDDIKVIIPATFSFTKADTYEDVVIKVGEEDENENFHNDGESNTQTCRSFLFPIGSRNLRLIDTPGIGDTRGLENDKENTNEILSYISQYKHMNGICILLKPNEERLTIPFRFCFNEILRHLPITTRENLIFIFTNARATFFAPGNTKKLVEALLQEHKNNYHVTIPFSLQNTFLFDSEPFRYLALVKNGIRLDEEQRRSYSRSWDHAVREYSRLMAHTVALRHTAVSDITSLNEAEQLIRKLPRPIAETAKLIEENIELAEKHKENIINNPSMASEGIPQNVAVVVQLNHPRTVCVGENCCRFINVNGEKKLEYTKICHDECYLKGVEQETLYDPKLEECTAMDPIEGFCTVCDCHWLQHKHITYEYKTNRTHINSDQRNTRRSSQRVTLQDIDQRIRDLRDESEKIQAVYIKLAKFLHVNSLVPVNNDIKDYLQYFIREEEMRKSAGAKNGALLAGLKKQLEEFTNSMELFQKTIQEQQNSGDMTDIVEPDKIFDLVSNLYKLPINGKQIEEQVKGIKYGQESYAAHHEKSIELPAKAASSTVMQELQKIVSS